MAYRTEIDRALDEMGPDLSRTQEGRQARFGCSARSLRILLQQKIAGQGELWSASWLMDYNFCRVHQTLRVTPTMEARIADRVWSVDETVWGYCQSQALPQIKFDFGSSSLMPAAKPANQTQTSCSMSARLASDRSGYFSVTMCRLRRSFKESKYCSATVCTFCVSTFVLPSVL
jgi:hypothetical protein